MLLSRLQKNYTVLKTYRYYNLFKIEWTYLKTYLFFNELLINSKAIANKQ